MEFATIAIELECCGVNNVTQWNATNYAKTPDSCCKVSQSQHIMGQQHRHDVYRDDPGKMNLRPQGLLRETVKLNDNGDHVADRSRTTRSDVEQG